MSEPRNETQLVKRMMDAVKLKYPNVWMLKTHGNGYQRFGIPDLLFCIDGQFIAIEVKHQKPGESEAAMLSRVSPRQRLELDNLTKAGALAFVAWSVDHVLEKIAEHLATV